VTDSFGGDEVVLACPVCHGPLESAPTGLACPACGLDFGRNSAGYLQFPLEAGGSDERSDRLDAYAAHQTSSAPRLYADFLRPYVAREPCDRLLDAGCGAGEIPALFSADGVDSYGVDLPKASGFWKAAGLNLDRFFSADVSALPFADGAFDVVLSLGVIEHVGTVTGHRTLAPDFAPRRLRFAREMMRVTRPGGRVLIACPNKSFPVDIHHGTSDAASQAGRIRTVLHRKTGMNVHRTWGRYHLVSYSELRALFVDGAAAASIRALPAEGYFGFGGVGGGVRRSDT
jgi:SAM-dependent methyltransferase